MRVKTLQIYLTQMSQKKSISEPKKTTVHWICLHKSSAPSLIQKVLLSEHGLNCCGCGAAVVHHGALAPEMCNKKVHGQSWWFFFFLFCWKAAQKEFVRSFPGISEVHGSILSHPHWDIRCPTASFPTLTIARLSWKIKKICVNSGLIKLPNKHWGNMMQKFQNFCQHFHALLSRIKLWQCAMHSSCIFKTHGGVGSNNHGRCPFLGTLGAETVNKNAKQPDKLNPCKARIRLRTQLEQTKMFQFSQQWKSISFIPMCQTIQDEVWSCEPLCKIDKIRSLYEESLQHTKLSSKEKSQQVQR